MTSTNCRAGRSQGLWRNPAGSPRGSLWGRPGQRFAPPLRDRHRQPV